MGFRDSLIGSRAPQRVRTRAALPLPTRIVLAHDRSARSTDFVTFTRALLFRH